ncbi:PIN domain-containing protein [Curtobacterium sp. NPDC086286]|uniref:PIN domain-containing protein n=1 Tax=Curtobacterium sp. NPDC086286 TaxID=3363964 RepID=UPI0037F48308
MLTVVLDTNPFHGARWLSSAAGQRLVDLARDGSCQVAIPEVVIDELERQHREALTKQRDEARGALSELRSLVDLDEIVAKFDDLLGKVAAVRDALLAQTGIDAAPVPEDITRDLVRRDLARRRPFMEMDGGKKKSFGFRDAVIWETLLDVAGADDSGDTIFFVTRDTGYFPKNVSDRLHLHLLEDLDQHGIPRDRIKVVDTLENVVEAVKAAVSEAEAKAAEARAAHDPSKAGLATVLRGYALDASRRAELVSVAFDAIQALIGNSIEDEMDASGGYSPPAFVQFDFPQEMESARIVAFEPDSDFQIDDVNGDLVVVRVELSVGLEGNTLKADYYVADEDIQILDVLNDYYFETMTWVRARAVVTIDTEQGSGHYDDVTVVLENNPNPPRSTDSTSVTLDFDIDSEPASTELVPDPGSSDLDPNTS